MVVLKSSSRTSVIAITTMCFLLLSIGAKRYHRSLRGAQLKSALETPQSTKCILYDRPPRTGSTTISATLKTCMNKNNYTMNYSNQNRTTAIRRMLSSPSNRIAAVAQHIAVSKSDVKQMKSRCGQLLYITSSAPMKKRLYSAAKYALSSGHGNTTVEGGGAGWMTKWLKWGRRNEPFLEAYPYVTEERAPLEDIPERMEPDYVVRHGNVDEDLAALLRALGCDDRFESLNVHRTSVDEDRVLESFELELGDWVYRWLGRVSSENSRGLKKARSF